ncbi:MAG: AI-2E family transporter, partial [Armatimonadota bacterium]
MENGRYPRVITAAALLVALAAGLYLVLELYGPVLAPIIEVLVPFAIALVFALLLDPLVDWLGKRGLARGLGVAVVGLGFIILFLLSGFLIAPRLADQAGQLAASLPDYTRRAVRAVNRTFEHFGPTLKRLHLPATAGEMASRFSAQIERAASGSLSFLAGTLTAVLSRLMWIIIIPLATLWMLKDLDYIKAKVVHFTPQRHKEKLLRGSAAVGGVFAKYVR